MSSYVIEWVWAFALTQIIEIPIYRRLLRASWMRAAGASLITHPLIWLLFPRAPSSYVIAAVIAELFAWLVEALYFTPLCGMKRALFASLVANAASLVFGMIAQALIAS